MYKNKDNSKDSLNKKEENILQIHNKIIKFFNDEKNNIDNYIQTIGDIYFILLIYQKEFDSNSKLLVIASRIFNKYFISNQDTGECNSSSSDITLKLSYKQYKDYIKLIETIDGYITKITVNEIQYIKLSDDLLLKYNSIIQQPINTLFIGKKVKNDSIADAEVEYKEQIKEFLLKSESFNIPIIPSYFLHNFHSDSSSSMSDKDNYKINSSSISNSGSFETCKNVVASPGVLVDMDSNREESPRGKRLKKIKLLEQNKPREDIIKLVSTINSSLEPKQRTKKKNVFCECIKKEENKIEQKLDNSSQVICAECGTIYTSSFSENITYNDYSRININQKYHYEKRCHFRDTINQFQGKQNKYIPEDVYIKLREMLEKHNLIRVEEKIIYINEEKSDSLEYDEKKTIPKKILIKNYDRVKKKHIRDFLYEINYSKYYEDEQLIYSKITGKEKPDISQYESKLFEDFEKLVKVFQSLENVSRKNFLNSHYVLRQLLLRQGVKVADNALNFLRTPQRLREHDEIYQRCCEILKWNFTPMS